MHERCIMKPLTQANLTQELKQALPEISWDPEDQELLYNIFGFSFNPFFHQAIKQNDAALLKRICAFLDRMAQSNDDTVRNILGITILKKLSPNQLKASWSYMSSHIKQVYTELQDYLQALFNRSP